MQIITKDDFFVRWMKFGLQCRHTLRLWMFTRKMIWIKFSFLVEARVVRWLMAHDDKLSDNAWYFTIKCNRLKKNWCSYHSNRAHHSINAVCHQIGRKTQIFFCSGSVYNHTLRPIHQYFIKIYYLWSLLWNLFISLSFHHLRRVVVVYKVII